MLGLYKALYDYAPQDPETELPLTEDQAIYILDKEDPEYVPAAPSLPRFLPGRSTSASRLPTASLQSSVTAGFDSAGPQADICSLRCRARWWKARAKPTDGSAAEDGPVGLVPSNYVEEVRFSL